MWTKLRVENCVSSIWDSLCRLMMGLAAAGAEAWVWLTAINGVTRRAASDGGTTLRRGWCDTAARHAIGRCPALGAEAGMAAEERAATAAARDRARACASAWALALAMVEPCVR